MKIRKKYCRYCGKAFYAKRIDAQYCSASCRGMGNRAKIYSNLYSGNMLIQFNINPDQYRTLLEMAIQHRVTAEDYARKLVLKAVKKSRKRKIKLSNS